MLFYSMILRSKHSEKILDRLVLRKRSQDSDSRLTDDTPLNVRYTEYDLSNTNDEFYRQYVKKEKYLLNIVHISEINIHIDVAFPIDALDKKEWEAEALKAFPECVIEKSYEIGIEEFKCDVSSGSYFSGRTRLFDKLGIGYQETWGNPMSFDLDEKVASPCKLSKVAVKKMAKAIMGSKSLMQEIDRIYSKENKKAYFGHPVHYFISAGDWGAAEDICKVLVSALYSNGRLISGRQTIIRDIKRNVFRDERFRQVLESTEGGMAMVEITGDMDYGRFATDFHEMTKHLGSIIETTKKDTLYIIVEVTGRSMDASEALANITGKADFVQITEGSGDAAEAKAYLFDLMDKADFEVENREEIMEYLPERETYTVTDIYKAYNAWYGSGLKNHVYKAYKEQKTFKVEVSKTESKPYEELQQMIGLSDVKALVDRILDAFRVTKARESMGLKTDGTSLHMLFSGNPGSAKTSVARLLAGILKDENVLTSGAFVECGRQDLVGRYVGWTAKIVEEKFRAAKGGVLFIDEAYALVDDSNSYGAEAINTITQLMENYRNDVIVIFAGYSDKMQNFLDQNEGLKSRIAFHLHFPDYSADELIGILKLMAEKREYHIDEDAIVFCRSAFETASAEENYGNGRYVRNFLEQAIMHQSSRVISESKGRKLGKDEMCLLKKEDFSILPQQGGRRSVKMGFTA